MIAARPPEVWAVLIDVERWPEWTASMVEVRTLEPSPLKPGSKVHIRQPRLPAQVWTVGHLDDGTSFSWTARSGGITSFAEHRVVSPGSVDAGSNVELLLHQSGTFAWLAALAYGRLIRRYLRLEVEGLKRAVEGGRAGSS